MEQDSFSYEVTVNWMTERRGVLNAPGLVELEVATPPEFPKGHPGIWSPEHYFVAAVNGCYMTSFLAVAEASNLAFRSFESKATGILKKEEGKYLITEVSLYPRIELVEEMDREKAERVARKAESICLITNSVRSKVFIYPEIVLADKEIAPAA